MNPPWLETIEPKLRELRSLGDNWDSYGAPPVTAGAAASLVLLLSLLVDVTVPPRLAATAAGGLLAFWHGNGEVEVTVDSLKEMCAYVTHGDVEDEFYLGSAEAIDRLVGAIQTVESSS